MTERFRILLDDLKLTPASFADRIGVQRSSISHIMAGRNKPSVDFLEKILAVFPDVDIYWLITGRKALTKTSDEVRFNPEREVVNAINSKEITEQDKKKPEPESPVPVEKLILVFKNDTFRIYNPSDR